MSAQTGMEVDTEALGETLVELGELLQEGDLAVTKATSEHNAPHDDFTTAALSVEYHVPVGKEHLSNPITYKEDDA